MVLGDKGLYVPAKVGRVDRLLTKLDFGAGLTLGRKTVIILRTTAITSDDLMMPWVYTGVLEVPAQAHICQFADSGSQLH